MLGCKTSLTRSAIGRTLVMYFTASICFINAHYVFFPKDFEEGAVEIQQLTLRLLAVVSPTRHLACSCFSFRMPILVTDQKPRILRRIPQSGFQCQHSL